MQSTPKIMVLQLKEIIYTAVFVILGILLILFFIYMVSSDKKSTSETPAETYTSGTYTASLVLNSVPMEVSVSVTDNYIQSVDLIATDDSVTSIYPLLHPSMEDIEAQLVSSQSLDMVSYENDNKYTCMVLLSAIESALNQAGVPQK